MRTHNSILNLSFAALLGAITPVSALADTYYVSSDAKADPDGSKNKPFSSVEAALAKVGGGHTLIVRPGNYGGPIQIAKRFAGTKDSPATLKSEVK
jgi:hypothetical protein